MSKRDEEFDKMYTALLVISKYATIGELNKNGGLRYYKYLEEGYEEMRLEAVRAIRRMTNSCKKCGLLLPPNHKKQFCVGHKHACWCNDGLNQWRLENGVTTRENLVSSFFDSIENHTILQSPQRIEPPKEKPL